MSATQNAAMTEAELVLFARKLDAFTNGLLPKERAFFSTLLADAADAANEDVSGYINPRSFEEDDVSGFAQLGLGDDSMLALLLGYAEGVNRATAEQAALHDESFGIR